MDCVESERIEMRGGENEYASQWNVSHVSHQQ